MAYEWLTLEQAAKHLGVSVRTLRRWIHRGKLAAELRPGPYGKQYLVPRQQLDGVQIVRDVERAERQEEREALPRVLEEYLARREGPLVQAIEALRIEMADAIRRVEERQDVLLREMAQIRRELSALQEREGVRPGE